MLPKISVDKINFEISEIDRLMADVKPLLIMCNNKKPDLVETMAIATILHSFYNGIENLFLIVVKEIDENIPQGQKWHKKLLEQVGKPTENRKKIISEENIVKLNEYLLFRHFFRHAYSFRLKWEEMESLVLDLIDVWHSVRLEINIFLEDSK